jgi:Endoplasmic reticulum protein ERp29, C-terminal domain
VSADCRDAKYYAKVFEKVKTNPTYPTTEKRRLEAIVAKGNMASDKYVPIFE